MDCKTMSYREAEEHLCTTAKGLILPVGTCEQHGSHLPLGTDTLVAEYLAGELSRHTGYLVAPSFSYGVQSALRPPLKRYGRS